MEETTTITLRLPKKLKARMDKLSKSTERSKSWLALDAIRAYLDLQEWQFKAIHQGIHEADEGRFASDKQLDALMAKWRKNAAR